MQSSTLTQKGQLTIPIKVRQELDLHAGDKVIFKHYRGQIILTKQKDDITAAFGLHRVNKHVSLQDIDKAIAEGPIDDLT